LEPGCSVVVVLFVVDVEVEELLPPQPAIATLAARTARAVSMAVSGVLFMAAGGLLVACSLDSPPYQPCF